MSPTREVTAAGATEHAHSAEGGGGLAVASPVAGIGVERGGKLPFASYTGLSPEELDSRIAAARGALAVSPHYHLVAAAALTATGAVVAYQVRRTKQLSRFTGSRAG